MDNQILLAAAAEAQEMAQLNVNEALAAAYRQTYGDKMDDPRFVANLLFAIQGAALKRLFKETALDPDANEQPGQGQLFPRPAWIVDTDDSGEEVYLSGDVASIDQVERHSIRVHRRWKAKVNKAAQNLTKVRAMSSYVAGLGVNTAETRWVEAVDNYSTPVIDSMKGATNEIEA